MISHQEMGVSDEEISEMKRGGLISGGESVDSGSDDRTANNAVRHQYRVLSDAEKAQMVAIKDKGAEFLDLIDGLRSKPEPISQNGLESGGMCIRFDRELGLAAERIEEAVMWAVKHITR
jgi:hypothetical protein